jgi:hypothetical protein
MLAITGVAPVLAGAALPAHIIARPPNGCDPRCGRGRPARLTLACLAWRAAG